MPHATGINAADRVIDPEEGNHPLYVNDGRLEQSQIGPLRPSTLDLPIEELRKRFDDDGYLFVKNILPRDTVLATRSMYFNFLKPTGVLKPGTSAIEGIFDETKDRSQFPGIGAGAAGGNGHPGEHAAAFVDRALEAHYQTWYHEGLCKHPALKNFVARLTGWGDNTKAFERTLLRNNVPGNKAIGVHYDQYVSTPGSVKVWLTISGSSCDMVSLPR
jgi:phytanoyl-CoA hydroxylase